MSDIIGLLMFIIPFFAAPLAAATTFVVSAVQYGVSKRKNRKAPGSVSEKRLHTLLNRAVASGIIAVLLICGEVAIIVQLNHSLVNM